MPWMTLRPVAAPPNPALVLTFAGALPLFHCLGVGIGDDVIDHHAFLVGHGFIDPAFGGKADSCSVGTS
jgi:hypothetical protein